MNSTPLYGLAYVSTALRLMGQEDLNDILAVSRKNNSADGITGLLLYHDGGFFQVLEGSEAAVRACYGRIENDPRHTGCIKLIAEKTPHRRFGAWDMAFVPFPDMDEVCRRGFLDLQKFRDTAKMREVEKEPEIKIFVDIFLANFRDL